MPETLLLLLRHADAEPGHAGIADVERGLTTTGVAQAEAVGRLLAVAQIVPDVALCSDARRARETLTALNEALPTAPTSRIDHALYGADADEILEMIRQHGGRARRLIVVGHNPSIHVLALKLAVAGDPRSSVRLGQGFPTAALAIFRAASPDWTGFGPDNAELVRFAPPDRT